MHAVFLDYKTVDAGDLDLESIRAVLPEIKVYPYSTEAEVLDRIQGIEVAIANKIEFDSKVFRTKDRPIAAGKVSIKLAIFYSMTLCLLALFVLLNFNSLTIIIGLISALIFWFIGTEFFLFIAMMIYR